MDDKTAIEWLNEARANGAYWVHDALENIAAQPDYSSRLDSYPYLCSVVKNEFSWRDSPQGYYYWDEVYRLVGGYSNSVPDRLFKTENLTQ